MELRRFLIADAVIKNMGYGDEKWDSAREWRGAFVAASAE
jgi:hypothetical protein